jgi:hypothetical protein
MPPVKTSSRSALTYDAKTLPGAVFMQSNTLCDSLLTGCQKLLNDVPNAGAGYKNV